MATALRLRNLDMALGHGDEVRLIPTRWSRFGLAALAVAILAFPLVFPGDRWLSVLLFCGATAIGAVGLNMLTGFTGQVSLGHAFFLGVGAYTTAYLGTTKGLSIFIWLPASALLAGLLGLVIGPAALRLKGNYLAVVSLGLLFLGDHIFKSWRSVTGGANGISVSPPLAVGPLDFNHINLLGLDLTRNQSLFYLIWPLVALTVLVCKNIARTRPGRAMQAVRDRDVAAEVIGVSIARYKLGAFALSSGLAGISGALYGVVLQYIEPGTWTLPLSIQFVAMIIIGGVGTIMGGVIGALFVGALPEIVNVYSKRIPFVTEGEGFGVTKPQLNQIIFGLLIVVFLVVEPRGVAALWLRLKAYLRSWPFSY